MSAPTVRQLIVDGISWWQAGRTDNWPEPAGALLAVPPKDREELYNAIHGEATAGVGRDHVYHVWEHLARDGHGYMQDDGEVLPEMALAYQAPEIPPAIIEAAIKARTAAVPR